MSIQTVSPLHTSTRSSIIVARQAQNQKQADLYNSSGGGTTNIPTLLPSNPSPTLSNANTTTAKTITSANNVTSGTTGGKSKRRKTKRRKTRKTKRRKTRRRK